MKKSLLTKLGILAMTSLFLFTAPISVFANENDTSSEEFKISTFVPSNRMYYMWVGDTLYQRLWSLDKGVWLDPYWYPAP